MTNVTAVQDEGLATQALKSVSYFLSFLIAFLLISSTINTFRDIEVITATIVVGGVIVALAAIVEYRTNYNVFDHLQTWVPILRHDASQGLFLRNGRLRVYASSQHPIALGAVLIMTTPLAIYLARRAASTRTKRLWQVASLALVAGAAETQSRTVILMLCAMLVVGLWLRGRKLVRYWPLLIVILAAIHVSSPAAIGNFYSSFLPSNGLLGQQETRGGLSGSGRLADLHPGLKLWKQKPVLGRGLGTEPISGSAAAVQTSGPASSDAIIFDDQYMTSLVETGLLGLIAVVWFVWGSFLKMARVAKERLDVHGDLLAAYTIACAGFVAGMITFDAFAFVQVTLMFFICAALGLRSRTLILERDPPLTAAAPSPTQ